MKVQERHLIGAISECVTPHLNHFYWIRWALTAFIYTH